MTKPRTKYSVVVPVFGSVNTLERLVNEIILFVAPLGTLEIIMVDDCSPDKSWKLLKQLKAHHSFMKIYRLGNNFGQAAATLCGIHHSTGDVIITIDDDLQYPSEEIPRMIRFYHENDYQMVLGIPRKKQRSGRYMLAEKLVRLFFRLRPAGHLNGTNISSSFRILSARLRDSSGAGNHKIKSIHLANQMLEPRFIGNILVEHKPAPKDKNGRYSLRKRLDHFTDMLLVFNKNPLSWLLWPALLLGIGSLVGITLNLMGLGTDVFTDIPAHLLVLIDATIILGLIIIGKYAGHIYHLQLGMPPYLIIESHE
ncbi:MAG: glycosyltransferase [Roseivirga sp.]